MEIIKHRLSKKLTQFLVASCMASTSSLAWAAGLLFPGQNVTNVGTAFAGTASMATDASTNFYNAAGLTRLSNPQWVAGANLSFPQSRLNVTRATSSTGQPVGTGVEKPKEQALLPFVHYAQPFNECWALGLSVAPTFGSRINYDESSLVRYMSTRSQLAVVDVAPSLSYHLTDHLSVGAGPDFVMAKLDLDTAIGFGNRAQDGFSKNTMKRTGWGYHLAGLYEWNDCTRMGLSYRSDYKLHLKGDSFFQVNSGTAVTKQGVRADTHFPEIVTLSGYHAINDQFAVMADLRWTRWERLKQLVISLDNGASITTTYNWKNTLLGAIGGTFQVNSDWQLKMGVSYENTPTTNATRTIAPLDEAQTALAMGLKYQFSRCVAVDLGYVHVLFKKININQPAPVAVGGGLPQGQQTVQANARHQIRMLGLQLTWDIM